MPRLPLEAAAPRSNGSEWKSCKGRKGKEGGGKVYREKAKKEGRKRIQIRVRVCGGGE